MGVSKIFQICKNMELRENQEWTNRNKTTRKKAEWYRGTATGVISDISDLERQPRIIKSERHNPCRSLYKKGKGGEKENSGNALTLPCAAAQGQAYRYLRLL